MLFKLAVELTILVIHVVNWAERNQPDRLGGEIGSMLLVFGLGGTVLILVRGAMEFGNDPPWTSKGVRKLVNLTACYVGANSLSRKNNVTNQIEFWIRPAQVDKFVMVSPFFFHQQACNVTED